MRYLFIIFFSLLFSCTNSPQHTVITKIDTVTVTQTVYKTLPRDTVYIHSQSKLTDSLQTQLFISNYKLERVKYYLKICLRNPSKDKWLKGWIKRAVQ